MKCIHRIDGKFRVVWRTKQRHMTSLQEFRNRRNRGPASSAAIETIAGPNHHAAVNIFLTNHRAIGRVAISHVKLRVQLKARASALINKRSIHRPLPQYGR